MKKLFTILVLCALIFSFHMQAKTIEITSAGELQTYFNGAQDGDTLAVMPGVYNVSNKLRIPATGAVLLKSFYDDKDSMAIIQMEMQANDVEDGVYEKRPSVIFDNLHLQGRHGDYTVNSGYIVSTSGKYISIDTLAFRNCEISQVSRCVFRGAPPAGRDNSGEIEWLEMSNCKVHHMNSDGNIWPILYVAHLPMYVHIFNNSFYDIPYAKSILQLTKMTPISDRNAEIYFENNTVAITYARTDGVLTTGNYLGAESLYNISNNMFLLPNWSDELNLSPDSSGYKVPAIIKCVGGIITAQNNIVEGFQTWSAGQIIDGDGQGGFLVLDTVPTYTMAELNFSWEKFANPQGDDFSFLSTEQPATAGQNGGPIGDPRWVKQLDKPRTLIATANIEAATIEPGKAIYEDGASVSVSASIEDGYSFDGWKKVSDGTMVSTENPYTFNISGDVELQAIYTALVVRNVSVNLAGTNTASYTITPDKETYFEGDVITIDLNTHFINNFMGWNDNNMDLSRTETLAADLNLTATFVEHPYYLAWDFSHLTRNNETFSDLVANFASNAENPGVMNYIMADTIRTISTRNNKFETEGKELFNGVARRTNMANFDNPDYLFIKFSTKGLSNIKVKSAYATDNSIFPIQKMQYSTDGTNYMDFVVDTVSGEFNQIWFPLEGVLPTAAENKDSVFVRWIADTSKDRLFVEGQETSETEFVYISQIVVLDNTFTSIYTPVKEIEAYQIYAISDKLFIQGDKLGQAGVYTLLGQKIKTVNINAGLNEFSGLKSGIYVVQVGSQVQKVLIK